MANRGVITLHMEEVGDDNSNSESEDIKCGSQVSSGSSKSQKEQYRNDDKCKVCRDSFTFTNRRHHCRRCFHSVCAKHSLRRMVTCEGQPPVRVCDGCIRFFVLMKFREETGDLVFRKQQQLDRLKDEEKRRCESICVKERSIVVVQETRNKKVADGEVKLRELEENAKRESEQQQRKLRILEELREGLKASKEAEQCSLDRLRRAENQLNALREEVGLLLRENELSAKTIDIRTQEFGGMIPIHYAKRIVCDVCKQKVERAQESRPRVESLETAKRFEQPEKPCLGCVMF